MPRAYVNVSKFRTPFNYPNLTLTGLGAPNPLRTEWPPGRSYIDTSRYRSPYIDYQFQDNTLFGLGADRVPRPRGQKLTAAAPPPPAPPHLVSLQRRSAMSGAAPSGPLPEALEAYVRTGAPMSAIKRDLGSALAQVPRVVWGLGGIVAGYMAYKAWKTV